MAALSKGFNSYWKTLVGDEHIFSMENRIFNGVCLFAIGTGSLNAIINIFLGLFIYGLTMFALIGIVCFCYYLSRFRNKLTLAVAISAISFNLLCGLTYFTAEASNGVNLYTFILIIFILTLVFPRKQFWIWIPLNLLLLIGLLTAEYLHPEWIEPLYTSPRHKLLDLAQTFFEVIFMIILITLFMKKSYNRERQLATSRLIALEDSNATKNKLFSIIAHDLRAPLASIENYLELLNQVSLSDSEKVVIEKNLLASTRQTSEMLHNLLSWSKDQMNGAIINLEPLDIHETLIHTIQFQHNLASEKNIELIYEENQTSKVIADSDMLQLVVRNLLNNAIKFSPSGERIRLSLEEKTNHVLIIVRDHGIGISDDKREMLFSLESRSTFGTHNEKGVGLGLKITKDYVELQNGEIWYESFEGQGTTFFVQLNKFVP